MLFKMKNKQIDDFIKRYEMLRNAQDKYLPHGGTLNTQ